MLIALIAKDKKHALQTSLDNRDAHLAYVAKTGIVETAGPFIEDGNMVGSLIILNVNSMVEAEGWALNDPYAKAGLFETVSLTEWKKVIG